MNVSDIKEQDGIWVINLTNDSGAKVLRLYREIELFPITRN